MNKLSPNLFEKHGKTKLKLDFENFAQLISITDVAKFYTKLHIQ